MMKCNGRVWKLHPFSFLFPPFPLSPVLSVIYQRSGKVPKKAATGNYNCIFPEPSPAAARRFSVPLHQGYSQPTL